LFTAFLLFFFTSINTKKLCANILYICLAEYKTT
jgi:hypothetical protein